MTTLPINKENAIEAHKTADAAGKKMLEKLLGKQHFITDIKERIKTFEDACEDQGINPTDSKFTTGDEDTIAYEKLKVIIRALNQGFVFDYTNTNQKKWWPYFIYEGSGFRFNVTFFDHVAAYSIGGSRFCLHSDELAKYVGTQFLHLYNKINQ